MTQRPNIVLIMADQLAPQFTEAYGHPVVKTPHMKALADRGARFDAAYCNAPLCAPSRASMMTGQLISRIAAYDNASELPASIPTFAHYLRQMGYHTCLSGKMHFVGPDQLHGFEERLTTDIYPADFAWTPDWDQPDQRIDKWYHNMETVREAGVVATSYQLEYDEEVAFFARRRLLEYAMHDSGPFAMVVSFIHPHDPYLARREWWDLYDGDQIDMPLTGPGTDPHTARLRHGIEADVVPVTEAEVRNARHAYYANTSYFDDKVGQVVATLDEAGLLDNTVVIVTSDHGDMLGERGLWYKMNFFEHAARVPLILAGPGVAAGTVDAPVSLVDLLPTVLDIAGQGTSQPALGEPVDGQSIWPLAQGQSQTGREVIGEYCAECASHPILMIRRGPWKYIQCEGDPPQLYDVEADPLEQVNLATASEHRAVLDAFAAEAATRWDAQALHADVLARQRQRRSVHAALETGRLTAWDYAPPRDYANTFVRNHVDWTEAADKMRWPPAGERT